MVFLSSMYLVNDRLSFSRCLVYWMKEREHQDQIFHAAYLSIVGGKITREVLGAKAWGRPHF